MRKFYISFNKEDNCVRISPSFDNYPRIKITRQMRKNKDFISVDFERNPSCGNVFIEESSSVSRDSEIVRFLIERLKEICGHSYSDELQSTTDFNWNLTLVVFSFLGIGL